MRKKLLSKKESEFDDWENSQPDQIVWSGNKAKGMSGQSFGEKIRHVTHMNRPNQQSQYKHCQLGLRGKLTHTVRRCHVKTQGLHSHVTSETWGMQIKA